MSFFEKKMGIIATNSYLAAFSAGTFIGITSAYIFLRHRFHQPKEETWKNGMEERFEVRFVKTFLNALYRRFKMR